MSSGANSAANKSLTPTLFSRIESKSFAVNFLTLSASGAMVYFFCKSRYIPSKDEGGRIVSKPWWVWLNPKICKASRRLSVPLREIPTASTCIGSLRTPLVGGGSP